MDVDEVLQRVTEFDLELMKFLIIGVSDASTLKQIEILVLACGQRLSGSATTAHLGP